jgi:hypothetical protein
MRLIHSASFIFQFTVIFVATSFLITFKHGFLYLSKMFDLPFEIIESLIALRLGKLNDENKDKKV